MALSYTFHLARSKFSFDFADLLDEKFYRITITSSIWAIDWPS